VRHVSKHMLSKSLSKSTTVARLFCTNPEPEAKIGFADLNEWKKFLYLPRHQSLAWKATQAADQVARGVSSLLFVENPITGIALVGALAYFSPPTAIAVLVGSILSIFWSKVLSLDEEMRKSGLVAFNGILVVAGTPFFITPFPAVAAISFFGSALAVYLFDTACKNLSFPVLTLPFVFVESLALALTKFGFGINPTFDFSSSPLPTLAHQDIVEVANKLMVAIPQSVTQICFSAVPSVELGAVFALLFLQADKKLVLSAFGGAAIGCTAGVLLGYDFSNMLLMWGLNSSLSAIAMTAFGRPYWQSSVAAIGSCAFYPFFIYLSTQVGILAFTLPFCFSTITCLRLLK